MSDDTNCPSNSKKQNTDAVPPGTPFAGENICRRCEGTARAAARRARINETPGMGQNQAPRQKVPGAGQSENGVVHVVNDGFVYPEVANVLRVTISGK